MGLISEMHKGKGPVGKKLPVPTTDGDDTVIAAKTGEYVLPPEVVAMIGVDKLDAMVAQMTGQQPGGKPAEMPEGMDMEMMEGEMPDMKGMMGKQPMMGHARGGRIDPLAPLNSQAMRETEAGLKAMNRVGLPTGVADANREAISGLKAGNRVTGIMPDQPMMEPSRRSLSEIMKLEDMGALGEDSNLMGFNKGGLVSHMMKHDKKMMGYNDGGFIEDDVRRRLSGYNPQSTIRQPEPFSPNANNLRNYNPQSTIPPNATTNASPRAPELRTFTPEPGRVQPGATTPRISGLAANPPAGTPSATVRALDARVPGDAAAVEAQRAKAAAQAGKLTNEAQRAAATAAQPPKPGLAGRAAQTAGRIGSLAKGATPFALNAGVNQSFADMDTGYRDEFARSVGAESPMGNVAADTARTFANIGDAVTLGLAGRVGRGIASAAGGGSFGEGFASDSDRDRFLASKQPQQVAAAPQMTDKERADEIARRRAALEGPQTAAAPSTPAPQASAPAPAAAPKRGPISGLAARANPAKAAAPSQPSAPAIDPAVMADAKAAEAELAQSPIARVVGGTGGTMTIQYKDGTTKQVGPEGMDEVNGFYALTNRAAKQYDAQPVEIIAGANSTQALPEYGYQQFPDAIARSGQAGDYIKGLAQGALDRADPVAAEQRLLRTKTDEQIRASNATDRDGAGRWLRNQLTQIELNQRKQIADLEQKALAGDQQAMASLNMLRSNGKSDDSRQKLVTDLIKAYSSGLTQPNMPLQEYVRQGLELATGTVQSSSAPNFQQYAAQIRAKNPGANLTDAQLQAAYKKQFQQGQ